MSLAWQTLVTPMEEPSRGGFTIKGRPNSAGMAAMRAALCSVGLRHTDAGVSRPWLRHKRLVMTLSMAMAEAITPEPV